MDLSELISKLNQEANAHTPDIKSKIVSIAQSEGLLSETSPATGASADTAGPVSNAVSGTAVSAVKKGIIAGLAVICTAGVGLGIGIPLALNADNGPSGTEAEQPSGPSTPTESEGPEGPVTPESPHTHVFGEWAVVLPANCTDEGSKERVCSCGEKETGKIPANGHTFGEWAVTSSATCTGEGSKERVCSCGEKETGKIPANGHTFGNWTVIKSATCTGEGSKERVCACGETETDTVPANGHTYNEELLFDAKGHWQECDICGDTTEASEHSYLLDGDCSDCASRIVPSSGLSFELNTEGNAYTVVGLGTANPAEIIIPSEYNGLPVTKIGSHAFGGNHNIKSVIIPSSITVIGSVAFSDSLNIESVKFYGQPNETEGLEIGRGAFNGCCFKSISLPQNLIKIGESAFGGTGLEEIDIPDSVTYIGEGAFAVSKLKSIKLSPLVTELADGLFQGCSELTEFIIPDSITKIGSGVFRNTPIKSLHIPENVTCILPGVLWGMEQLETLTVADGNDCYYISGNCLIERKTKTLIAGYGNAVIPDDGSVTSIAFRAFDDNKAITTLVVPGSVTSIGTYAFAGSNITEITFSEGCTELGELMLGWCYKLVKITLPSTITSIPYGCFAYSIYTLTKDVYYNGTQAEWDALPKGDNWTSGTTLNIICTLKCRHTFGEWEITQPATCTDDGVQERVCAGCGDSETDTVPANGHNYKEELSFDAKEHWQECDVCGDAIEASEHSYNLDGDCSDCASHLTPSTGLSFTLNSAKTAYSVTGMTVNLTDIIIPSEFNGLPVTHIQSKAFTYNNTIKSVIIPSTITEIEACAFMDCYYLESVKFYGQWNDSESLVIGNSAFKGCNSLKYVSLPQNLKTIYSEAFSGTAIEEIDIPDGVTRIDTRAFSATPLKTVKLPASLKRLTGNMFEGCTELTEVIIPEGVEHIGTNAFGGSAIKNLYIPASVTEIWQGAFSRMDALESIEIASGNNSYYVVNNCVIGRNDKTLICGFGNNPVIPDDGSVQIIGASAFQGNKTLTAVVIPSGVTEIGEYAFASSNITEITLPEGCTKIHYYAFQSCGKLTKVTLPSTITLIDYMAFAYSKSIKQIYFNGTQAEWDAIEKGRNWNVASYSNDLINYTLICTKES